MFSRVGTEWAGGGGVTGGEPAPRGERWSELRKPFQPSEGLLTPL